MGEILHAMGLRIRQQRERLGLSQRQLAELLGTAPPNLNYYERGSRSAPIEVVVNLAKTLGVSTDYLLGGAEDLKFYADDEVASTFEAFRRLPPRSRKIITEMIQVLEKLEKEPGSKG